MQPPTPRMSVTPAAHQISMHSVNDDTAMMRAKKHFSYAMHFPIAQVNIESGIITQFKGRLGINGTLVDFLFWF